MILFIVATKDISLWLILVLVTYVTIRILEFIYKVARRSDFLPSAGVKNQTL